MPLKDYLIDTIMALAKMIYDMLPDNTFHNHDFSVQVLSYQRLSSYFLHTKSIAIFSKITFRINSIFFYMRCSFRTETIYSILPVIYSSKQWLSHFSISQSLFCYIVAQARPVCLSISLCFNDLHCAL